MTRIAINYRVAAGMMFDAGMGENAIGQALNEIKQASPGYFYGEDVIKYIKAWVV